MGPFTNQSSSADYIASIIVPEAGSITAIYGFISTNGSGTNNHYFYPVDNGTVETSFDATPCNVTSSTCSATGTVAVAANDLVDVQICPQGATGCPAGTAPTSTVHYSAIGLAFKPSSGTKAFVSSSVGVPAPSSTRYIPASALITSTTTEYTNNLMAPVPLSFGQFELEGCYTTGGSGSRTFNARSGTSFNTGLGTVSGQTAIASWNPSTSPGTTNTQCSGVAPVSWDFVTTGNWNLAMSGTIVNDFQVTVSGTPDTLGTLKTTSLITMTGP